jgi:hypothetical protein
VTILNRIICTLFTLPPWALPSAPSPPHLKQLKRLFSSDSFRLLLLLLLLLINIIGMMAIIKKRISANPSPGFYVKMSALCNKVQSLPTRKEEKRRGNVVSCPQVREDHRQRGCWCVLF